MQQGDIRAVGKEIHRTGGVDVIDVAGGAGATGIGGVEARVRQARVVVHVVQRQIGAVVEPVGVVVQLDAVLAPGARFPVGQALDGGGAVGDAGQRIVLRRAEVVRVQRRLAEAGVDELADVVGAHRQAGEVGARGLHLDRLPFELVEAFHRGVFQRLEAEVDHVDRGEEFLHLAADAEHIVGVDRIGLVDAVQHQGGALAPVHQLPADLEGDGLVCGEGNRQLAVEIGVEVLDVGAGLGQGFAVGALAADVAAAAVNHEIAVAVGLTIAAVVEQGALHRTQYAADGAGEEVGDVEAAEGIAQAGGDGRHAERAGQARHMAAYLQIVLRRDFVGMGFGEIVVDEIVEVQAAGKDAETLPGQGQVGGDLGRSLEQVVFRVVQIALVAVDRSRARRVEQDLRRVDLILEQALADLVGAVGAAADIGIDVALADQVLALRLHAYADAGGEGGVEHPFHALIAAESRNGEINGLSRLPGQQAHGGNQNTPYQPQAQNALHRSSPPLRARWWARFLSFYGGQQQRRDY